MGETAPLHAVRRGRVRAGDAIVRLHAAVRGPLYRLRKRIGESPSALEFVIFHFR